MIEELYKKRKTSTIPFGYELDKDDKDLLKPIASELEALEQAKEYLKVVKGIPTKSSWREVTNWLVAKTGRYISHQGLKKRVLSEMYSVGSPYYPAKAKKHVRKARAS